MRLTLRNLTERERERKERVCVISREKRERGEKREIERENQRRQNGFFTHGHQRNFSLGTQNVIFSTVITQDLKSYVN